MAIHRVSANWQLKEALAASSAAGGGTILLENTGETYNLDVVEAGSSTGLTTIKSADVDNPAVMDGVRLVKSQNIAFENLSFDSRGVSRPGWLKDFMVEKSQNIAVSDSTFISRADGTFMERRGDVKRGEDMGFVRETEGFTFENNTVSNYFNGLTLIDSSDLNVTDNEFSRMQGDGIRGGGMQDAVFEGNWLHDWYGSAKNINHDDMFQIWGTNMETLSKNILIKGNFFDSGEGSATQTILIQNEHWSSEADNYTNIVVTDNVIYNGHTHGISVYDTTGVEVTNNTVLYNAQSSTPSDNVSNAPSIRVGNAEGAIVSGNIAAKTFIAGVSQESTNAHVNFDSAIEQDFVSHHFVNVYNGGKVDMRDLELLPDSPWHGVYGATATQGGGPDTGVTAVMTQTAVEGEYGAYILDASLSHDEDGYLASDSVAYEWHFEDGSVLKSETVKVDFSTVGQNEIMLVAIHEDGSRDSIVRSVYVEDPVIRDIDFNDGALTRGVDFADFGDSNFVDGLEGQGFLLDGDSEVVFNKKDSRFYELDQFTIEVAFQKADLDDSGRLFDLHRSMGLSVKDDGSLRFSMQTSDGGFNVDSGSTVVQDTDWHKISVTYNAAYQELSLWLDGQKLGEETATGTTIPFESWGPMLGNLNFKGDSVTAVVDDFLFSREALDDFEIQQDHIGALSLDPSMLGEIYTAELSDDGSKVSVPAAADVQEPVEEEDFVVKSDPIEEEEAEVFEQEADEILFAEDPVIRDIDFNDGALTRGVDFADFGDSNFVDGLEGQGFLLDGDSEVVFNKKDSRFYELDQFTIEVAFQKADLDDSGRLFDLHRSMGLSVKDDGSLRFSMQTSDGGFNVNSGSTVVQDTDWHKISVTYNAAYQELSLWLDGQKLGEETATGTTIPFESWGPMLGNLNFKGDSVTAVVDDFLFSREALDDFEIQQDHIGALSLDPSMLGEIYTAELSDDGSKVSVPAAADVQEPVEEEDFVVKSDPIEEEEAEVFEQEADEILFAEDPVIRDIDFNDGALTRGVDFADFGDSNFVDGLEGQGFLLDGDSEVVFNKKDSRFYELDQFTIEVAFQKADLDDSGRLFDLHRSMGLSVKDDGSLRFSMQTSDGGFNVDSGSTVVQDTDWHKISVTYNAAYQELSLWLDGQKLGEETATGTTIPFESWGPMLGNLNFKGDSVTAVVDDFLFSREALDDFEIQQDHIGALSLDPSMLGEIYTAELSDDGSKVSVPAAADVQEPVEEEDFVVKSDPIEEEEAEVFEQEADEILFAEGGGQDIPDQFEQNGVDSGTPGIVPLTDAIAEIFDISSWQMTSWDLAG